MMKVGVRESLARCRVIKERYATQIEFTSSRATRICTIDSLFFYPENILNPQSSIHSHPNEVENFIVRP